MSYELYTVYDSHCHTRIVDDALNTVDEIDQDTSLVLSRNDHIHIVPMSTLASGVGDEVYVVYDTLSTVRGIDYDSGNQEVEQDDQDTSLALSRNDHIHLISVPALAANIGDEVYAVYNELVTVRGIDYDSGNREVDQGDQDTSLAISRNDHIHLMSVPALASGVGDEVYAIYNELSTVRGIDYDSGNREVEQDAQDTSLALSRNDHIHLISMPALVANTGDEVYAVYNELSTARGIDYDSGNREVKKDGQDDSLILSRNDHKAHIEDFPILPGDGSSLSVIYGSLVASRAIEYSEDRPISKRVTEHGNVILSSEHEYAVGSAGDWLKTYRDGFISWKTAFINSNSEYSINHKDNIQASRKSIGGFLMNMEGNAGQEEFTTINKVSPALITRRRTALGTNQDASSLTNLIKLSNGKRELEIVQSGYRDYTFLGGATPPFANKADMNKEYRSDTTSLSNVSKVSLGVYQYENAWTTLTNSTDRVPVSITEGIAYSGITVLANRDSVTFVHPMNPDKVVVIENDTLTPTGNIHIAPFSVLPIMDSTDQTGKIDANDVVYLFVDKDDVLPTRYKRDTDLTTVEIAFANTNVISVVDKSSLSTDPGESDSIICTVDTIADVPTLLDANKVYTGTTVNGRNDLITYLNPSDTNEVIFVVKTARFTGYSGTNIIISGDNDTDVYAPYISSGDLLYTNAANDTIIEWELNTGADDYVSPSTMSSFRMSLPLFVDSLTMDTGRESWRFFDTYKTSTIVRRSVVDKGVLPEDKILLDPIGTSSEIDVNAFAYDMSPNSYTSLRSYERTTNGFLEFEEVRPIYGEKPIRNSLSTFTVLDEYNATIYALENFSIGTTEWELHEKGSGERFISLVAEGSVNGGPETRVNHDPIDPVTEVDISAFSDYMTYVQSGESILIQDVDLPENVLPNTGYVGKTIEDYTGKLTFIDVTDVSRVIVVDTLDSDPKSGLINVIIGG